MQHFPLDVLVCVIRTFHTRMAIPYLCSRDLYHSGVESVWKTNYYFIKIFAPAVELLLFGGLLLPIFF